MGAIRYYFIGVILTTCALPIASQNADVSRATLPNAPGFQPDRVLEARNNGGEVPSAPERSYNLVVNNLASLRPEKTGADRVVNRRFLLINSLHLATAMLDVALTQECIANHQCKEGNPMMPSSQVGQLAVSLAFVSYGAGVGYWLKKHGSKMWWLAPVVGTASHIVGAATGFAHQ